jgi:hypothetical protein
LQQPITHGIDGMTSGVQAPGARMWRTADRLHVDVRGLPCPEPLVTVLRLIEAGEAGDHLVVHLSQEPLLLYPELDARGWRHRVISPSGASGEDRALDGAEPGDMLLLEITRAPA